MKAGVTLNNSHLRPTGGDKDKVGKNYFMVKDDSQIILVLSVIFGTHLYT